MATFHRLTKEPVLSLALPDSAHIPPFRTKSFAAHVVHTLSIYHQQKPQQDLTDASPLLAVCPAHQGFQLLPPSWVQTCDTAQSSILLSPCAGDVASDASCEKTSCIFGMLNPLQTVAWPSLTHALFADEPPTRLLSEILCDTIRKHTQKYLHQSAQRSRTKPNPFPSTSDLALQNVFWQWGMPWSWKDGIFVLSWDSPSKYWQKA